MIRQLAMTEEDRRCAGVLLESDRRYFEMAADITQLSVGELTWMSGLTGLAASTVIHRVDIDALMVDWSSWLDEVENVLRSHVVAWARIYFDDCAEKLNSLFRCRGYERRCEVGFLAPVGHPSPPPNVQICQIRSDDEWNLKRAIHEQAMDGPDGYTNQADLWVEMERRKCDTGKMQSYLIQRDGEIVGTVGAIIHDGLLRLKNILVAPPHRRRGLGVAAVHLLWKMAEAEYGCRFGVFGVEGGKGEKLYKRAGLYPVTYQYEWSRLLAVSHE